MHLNSMRSGHCMCQARLFKIYTWNLHSKSTENRPKEIGDKCSWATSACAVRSLGLGTLVRSAKMTSAKNWNWPNENKMRQANGIGAELKMQQILSTDESHHSSREMPAIVNANTCVRTADALSSLSITTCHWHNQCTYLRTYVRWQSKWESLHRSFIYFYYYLASLASPHSPATMATMASAHSHTATYYYVFRIRIDFFFI